MVVQKPRRLITPFRASSLELLFSAAESEGLKPEIRGRWLHVRATSKLVRLTWGRRQDPVKSSVPRIVTRSGCIRLRSCPTRRVTQSVLEPPWLPAHVKPDRSTGARGARSVMTAAVWRRLHPRIIGFGERYVVQPLLQGMEFRATLCADGTIAVAELISRGPHGQLWRDAPTGISHHIVSDLHRILLQMNAPVAGFDVIKTDKNVQLIDVNLSPSLAIHLATNRPRDISHAALRALVVAARNGT